MVDVGVNALPAAYAVPVPLAVVFQHENEFPALVEAVLAGAVTLDPAVETSGLSYVPDPPLGANVTAYVTGTHRA